MNLDPTDNQDPSDVTPLRKAQRNFLEHKQKTQKESTARAYKFPTKDFIQYCENHGVQTTGDITKNLIATWMDQRHEEVKPITVHNNAKHLRVFIKWMGSRDLCEWRIHEKMEIPSVPDQGEVNDDVLRAGHAKTVLDYLDTYNYASLYHALFYTMWHTGCRIGGAIALDLDDFQPSAHDDNVLHFRNRKATGTPLKNKTSSERDVTITDSLADVLADYISAKRLDKTDDYDREPIFTVPSGRLYQQRSYKNVVALTRPCISGENCPHNRDIPDCEAAQRKEKAPSCPSSYAHHPVRKGSITNHINKGWPKEALAERVDVSVDVLNKHYDKRTNEKERQTRRQYLHED